MRPRASCIDCSPPPPPSQRRYPPSITPAQSRARGQQRAAGRGQAASVARMFFYFGGGCVIDIRPKGPCSTPTERNRHPELNTQTCAWHIAAGYDTHKTPIVACRTSIGNTMPAPVGNAGLVWEALAAREGARVPTCVHPLPNKRTAHRPLQQQNRGRIPNIAGILGSHDPPTQHGPAHIHTYIHAYMAKYIH